MTVKVPQHLELIRPALKAGKPVFSEWPLGVDLAQAKELADLADRRGLLTAVGLQARSAPPLRYLRDLVAEGYVGGCCRPTFSGRAGFGARRTTTATRTCWTYERRHPAVDRLRALRRRADHGARPDQRQRSLTQWTGRSAEPAHNVAHGYALLREQITGSLAPGTDGVPDFQHAVRRHAMLEQIRKAARTGRKVTLAEQSS